MSNNSNNLKSRSKSSLFLMELIIVIMFFSLSAAICMQIFAQAKTKTDYSRNVTNAAFAAESIADMYKAKDGDLKAIAEKLDVDKKTENSLEIYYDNDWNTVSKNNAKFVIRVTETEEPSIAKAFIEVETTKDKENIFDIVSTVVR